MAISNEANVLFDGITINSNIVTTSLDLPLTLVKSVNLSSAMSGQTLIYIIVISNPNETDANNILFTDAYDNIQTSYIANSFEVDGTPTTPTTTNPLTYTIPTIPSSESVTLEFSVLVL